MIGIIVILSWLGIPCLKRILLGHICGLCSALSEQYCSLNCEFSTFLPMSIASRHRSSTLLTGGAGNFAPACFFADRKIVCHPCYTVAGKGTLFSLPSVPPQLHQPVSGFLQAPGTKEEPLLWFMLPTPKDTCQLLFKTFLLSSWW